MKPNLIKTTIIARAVAYCALASISTHSAMAVLIPDLTRTSRETYEHPRPAQTSPLQSHKLIVYKNIPGLAANTKYNKSISEYYTIKVRIKDSGDPYANVFTLKSYNRCAEIAVEHGTLASPDWTPVPRRDGPATATGLKNYLFHTSGWSHTYGNIEMTNNTPVEVEITAKPNFKIAGENFYKASIYPPNKASTPVVEDNKVTFTIYNPGQITVDINGNLEDSNKVYNDSSGLTNPQFAVKQRDDIRHTVSLFANPILPVPDSATGIQNAASNLNPTNAPVLAAANKTLNFRPGVHDVGLGYQLISGKDYHIPGDAIIFGTFNNLGARQPLIEDPVPASTNPANLPIPIKYTMHIYGCGTISSQFLDHAEYIGYNIANKNYTTAPVYANQNHDCYKNIFLQNCLNVQVTGITISDPANHSCNIGNSRKSSEPASNLIPPQTACDWVKVISWRGNGDGLGNQESTTNCFLRTNDDSGYIKGNKSNCIYWKDSAARVFYMQNVPSTAKVTSLSISNCDLIFSRSRSTSSIGGVFSYSPSGETSGGTTDVNLLVDGFRCHDRLADRIFFEMNTYSSPPAFSVDAYNGITFRNITVLGYDPTLGVPRKQFLRGTLPGDGASAVWGLTKFDNVNFNGTPLSEANENLYFDKNNSSGTLDFTPGNPYTAATGLITANKFRGESHPGNDSLVRVTGTKVNYIKNGNWIEFPDFNFAGGAKSITLNASSPIGNCTVELYVNTRDSYNLIGTVPIGSTTSFTTPLNFTINTLKPVKGLQNLIMKFVNPSNTGYIMDLYSLTLNDLNADFTIADLHSVKNSTILSAPKVIINTNPLIKAIEYITHGTSATYSDVDLAGATSVTINASSLNTGGRIIVRSKLYNKDYCAITVTPTSAWTTYQNFTANIPAINLPTATDHIELVFESTANPLLTTPLFNVKSVKFNKP